MCTVSFIPKGDIYLLAMNRDDLYARASSLPLVRVQFPSHVAAYPQETGGGTWIGANQHGITLALLNWAVPATRGKQKSRGALIPEMLVAIDVEHARIVFESIDLGGTWPFRLIGIFPAERVVCEWRWDGERRSELSHDYCARHWFSSGASDEKAEQVRSAVCARSWRHTDAGTRDWVRRLHATHDPEQGLFSICAHRDVGGTLSYTEIEMTRQAIALSYSPFSPCTGVRFSDAILVPRLVPSVTFA
jgi:Transport and Golgi organisation 2